MVRRGGKYASLEYGDQPDSTRRSRRRGVDPDDRPLDDGSEYTPDQVEWILAMGALRRRLGRMPTCGEILTVAHSLGYRRYAP